ncbi:MAG: CARDB domain-containing protein [Candidatus Hadarchaeales archaeon]
MPIPRFIVENLRLSKENVRVGEQVTIFVDIANIGTASGEYTIVLKVNGEVKDNRKVTLEAGQRRTITFQLQLNEIGEHIISVDGLTAAISVIKTEMPTSTIPTVIIVSIIIGLVAVFTVLKFVVLPKIFG